MTAPDALHFAACITAARRAGFPHYAQALVDLYVSARPVPPSGIRSLTANDRQAIDPQPID